MCMNAKKKKVWRNPLLFYMNILISLLIGVTVCLFHRKVCGCRFNTYYSTLPKIISMWVLNGVAVMTITGFYSPETTVLGAPVTISVKSGQLSCEQSGDFWYCFSSLPDVHLAQIPLLLLTWHSCCLIQPWLKLCRLQGKHVLGGTAALPCADLSEWSQRRMARGPVVQIFRKLLF